MEASTHTEGGPAGTVTGFLDKQGIEYELIEHEQEYSAAAEAHAAGIEPENATKSVLLRDKDGYRLAVIPASERLDVHKVREVLDAGFHLRLATEDEMSADFPGFELGAIPPLGPMLPAPEIVDRSLLDHDRVLCNAGDHSHSVVVRPQTLVDLAEAQVADICEE